ncbi:MAG TPA: hypothetical protein VFT79_06340 [Solirubrobacterales bacterium]|nr:hypothetical protein [Solirubrobacterales bacterium]
MPDEEKPLGPRKFDFRELTDDDFEEMCHELIRLESPAVVKTAAPDGGADSLLPKNQKGWERAWQAKRYTGTIYWSKCKDSLDRAIKTYKVRRVTFCFAKNLTEGQQKKFNSDLKGRHEGVEIDFWDKTALVHRLNNSPGGQRVARHYFGDPAHDKDLIIRAVRAGGPLERSMDAVERARPVGEFLAGHDPYFTYPQVTHEEGLPEPPAAEGTIMSVTSTDEGISIRHDAIPRHRDAMERFGPRITMSFTDDEAGRRAAKAFAEGTSRGRPVVLEEGVEVTPERLPPLWEEEVGKTIKARVEIRPNIPPWVAQVTADSDKGSETLVIPLEAIDDPPADWDLCFRGHHGGLTFSILMRKREHGEITMNWSYTFDTAPAREQVGALRLITFMHGQGEILIRDLKSGRPDLRHPTNERTLPDEIPALLGFLEDVVAIEDWLEQGISIPDREIKAQEARHVAMAAEFIRHRSIPVQWKNAKMKVGPEGLSQMQTGGEMVVEQDLGMTLFGKDLWFARGRLVLPDYEMSDLGPAERDSDIHNVEVVPVGNEPLSLEWQLQRPQEQN